MKILHCITGLTGDGAQRMLLRLATSMREFGVQSTVVNLGDEQGIDHLFEQEGVPVRALRIQPTPQGAMLGVARLRKTIQEVQPDIIQGWMYHANLLAFSASRATRSSKAVVWNIRRGLDDYAERRLKTRFVIRSNAALSKMVNGIVYCTSVSKAQHEHMGFHSRASVVLENGFDANKFAPRPDASRDFRRKYGIDDEEILIGNIGRYDIAKGHSYLAEAFGRVLARKPSARLVLIGRGVLETNKELVAQLERSGSRGRVIMLGEQDAIENLHQTFDIYCSSSISEGFPNALSEAMACGVPCVTTDTGASQQLVEGVGRVVPPRDSEKLADALIATIEDGVERRRDAGERGRQRILNRYALPSVARRYFEYYSGLLAAC
jgi:glycosyltransferase involved in cell wall biosynthesis